MKVKIIILLLLAAALCCGSFVLGRITAPEADSRTFYAEVESVMGTTMTVAGLEVNDINHRGRFQFSMSEDIGLTWRYTDITWEDLRVGDTIAVTYTGLVQETSPAVMQNVIRIELLEDRNE